MLGLCAAFLALAGQIVLGGSAALAASAAAADDGFVGVAICQSGQPTGASHEAPGHRHGTCPACPICFAQAHPAVIERPPAVSLRARPSIERRIALPMFPPLAAGAAGAPAYPTGPPSLT